MPLQLTHKVPHHSLMKACCQEKHPMVNIELHLSIAFSWGLYVITWCQWLWWLRIVCSDTKKISLNSFLAAEQWRVLSVFSGEHNGSERKGHYLTSIIYNRSQQSQRQDCVKNILFWSLSESHKISFHLEPLIFPDCLSISWLEDYHITPKKIIQKYKES